MRFTIDTCMTMNLWIYVNKKKTNINDNKGQQDKFIFAYCTLSHLFNFVLFYTFNNLITSDRHTTMYDREPISRKKNVEQPFHLSIMMEPTNNVST